jgi:hypothetical protein
MTQRLLDNYISDNSQNLAGRGDDEERELLRPPGLTRVPRPPPPSRFKPLEALGAPVDVPKMESAYRPHCFQKDQYIYFIWPKIHYCNLTYRLSDDGLGLTVRINRDAVSAGNTALAPYVDAIPMGIPAFASCFEMALPHKCSPLDHRILRFESNTLVGLRLTRCTVDGGHELN